MSTKVIDNRYVVQQPLGSGAQGEVYRVHDTHEDDVVALKLLTMALPAGAHWEEAQILRRLSDAHILGIRNADVDAGRPYIVTELAMHGTLDDRVTAAGACGVGVDDAVRWMRQACVGVARAHDLRLLHNDLKPGNLFLNAEGECLVGDFGFAAALPSANASVAIPGATAETAAPEVAGAWPTPMGSRRTDVYSLGATAFWLLAGRAPHDLVGVAGTPARMAKVASDVPPRLRDLAPHVPQYVATAIERAMARTASDRFATVTDFAAALGTRPAVSRRWRRTDEHARHLACWRGERRGHSTYVLCLEQGARPSQAVITTRHAVGGHRLIAGCRNAPMRSWGQAVRSAMRRAQ